jgi:hypothetical protein
MANNNASSTSGQSAAQSAAAQNLPARQMLIGTGLYMTRMMQPVTANLGSPVRVPLDRVGVCTGVTLQFTVPINITATATASPFAPYNFGQLITYTDFAGLQRVITNGYQLHALNCFKGHKVAGNAVNYDYVPGSEVGINTNITNVPTATGTANLTFFVYVPFAYDPSSDLRGAVLAQSIYGEHYITVTTPSTLVGTDPLASPYTAGTVAMQSGAQVSIQAWLHYIMPQQGVNNLPMVDLSTIYAIEGNYNDSSNWVAGQPKYLNWPNNRAILSALHIIDSGATGGVLNETNITSITLLGNSNTNIKELLPSLLRYQMRYQLGTDMPSGVLYMPSRSQPITTQLYGNVQTKLLMATAPTNTYSLSQYESTYLSGTPLPGVVQ